MYHYRKGIPVMNCFNNYFSGPELYSWDRAVNQKATYPYWVGVNECNPWNPLSRANQQKAMLKEFNKCKKEENMYCEKTIILIRKEVDSARQEIAYIERKPGANVRVAYLEAVTKLNNLIEDYQNAICVLETFNRPKLLQEFDFKAKALKEDLDVAVSDLEGIEATLTNTRADIVEIQQELKSLNFMRDTIRTLYITPGYPQESPSGPRMNPPAGY